ncbi:MAG: hypothetical protein ABIJ16_08485 [Bacteroidota bacterium]
MDYTYDIFISCTAENKPEVAKWVTDFSGLIKSIIDRILKRDANILTSLQLSSDDTFAKSAPVEIFSKTGAFIIVLDDSYAASTKSAQELATILSVVQKDVSGASHDRRIFKILLSDIKKANQPDYVRNILPYRFYLKSEAGIVPVDFEKHTDYVEIREFRLRLIDLAYSASYIIRAAGMKTNKTIYLAETGPDQVYNREIIKRELIHYGYNVLPDKWLPEDKDMLEKYIMECMGFADIAVHIFGSLEGAVVQGTNTNIVEYQNQIGAKYCRESNKKIKRLIWIPPDLLFEEESQRINIEKLKRSSEELKGAELVQTPIEEFKSILHRNMIVQSHGETGISDGIDGLIAYIMFEQRDIHAAESVMELLTKSGIKVNRLDMNIENHNLISIHRKNMVTCDGVIIVTDNPSDQWTRSKLNDVLKSMGFGRKKDYKVKALVTGNDRIENLQVGDDYLIISKVHGAFEEQMKPLIEKLKN